MKIQTILSICIATIGLLSVGCNRQDMRDQSRYEPLESSTFFEDGQASRQFVEHTVARGHLNLDPHMFEGRVDGEYATDTPMPVTVALLDRGEQRYNIYCTPCHDRVGTGHGMVVQRGFTKPPSFHDVLVREKPVGYYFEVMTKGFGRMPDYAAQIKHADRWAIAAYIRALQLSQSAKLDELPAEDQALIAAGSADTHDAHGHADDGHEDDGHSENH